MSKSPASQTPVMRQFLTAKSAHPDALLFFRMGDFYELFYDDAVVAARALDLTLTARNKGAEDEVPMAGVPHHAASAYVQRLLEQGFKVAICEQMADPSKVKGIVPREVVRVVSPGIAYDDAGLQARENHYLAAVECSAQGPGPVGIAALDLSTGELHACVADDTMSALSELVRLEPREVLLGPRATELAGALLAARPQITIRTTDEAMTEADCAAVLDAQFGPGEATASCPAVVSRKAAARCVAIARACEAGRRLPVARIVAYALGDTLVIDEATQAHLELVRCVDGTSRGSLLAQIDSTRTAPGARLLRRRLLAPLVRVADIRRRHDAVELFVVNPGLRQEVREALAQIADLERLAVKLALDRTSPRDLASLRGSLATLPLISEALDRCGQPLAREALGVGPGEPWVDPCADLSALLARALGEDPPARTGDPGTIRDGFDAVLDAARELMRGGQRLIVELESRLRESAGIPGLKLRFTRVFGWYIEVSRSQVSKAPPAWRRKQTVASGERFTCDELDALADDLAHAEERAATRELELFGALVRDLAARQQRLRAIAMRLAEWDVASALAEVAHRDDWVRPEVDDSLDLVVTDGRHPVVERLAAAGRFVPNDAAIGAGDGQPRLWLVTGPNMAGKSTFMRQMAICAILCQMGAFVPARSARIGVVDRVLTRVGASDNLSRGESTFMVEMKETANVLRRATKRSFVILDEIGRGTSTYDGLAIAWAVAEHLHDAIACRAMFATHYHELTELAATRERTCENWSVSAREHAGDLVFLHKLQRGAASRSYGVACARLAGLPEPVLARARAVLAALEQGSMGPDGGPPPMRIGPHAARSQLDLFGGPAKRDSSPHPVLDTLRAVDVDRLTPLEALQLVATLKTMTVAS
ncbi:MAG TPA: DNA mismatch repair protein MutS [Polyangiaceae bacterium]|nr:DNA mismatch repair protein MutS [Polyangiaceae bacterium]